MNNHTATVVQLCGSTVLSLKTLSVIKNGDGEEKKGVWEITWGCLDRSRKVRKMGDDEVLQGVRGLRNPEQSETDRMETQRSTVPLTRKRKDGNNKLV